MRRVAAILAVFLAAPAGSAEWNTPESRARWSEVSALIFGSGARFEKSDRLVTLEAPSTVADASLVPVTIRMAPGSPRGEFSLVIDQNPAPLAATVRFGPAGDARRMKLRVRVDGFTNMHAVSAAESGTLLQNAVFVRGAGGCSAPMGMSAEEASRGMGEMRMKFSTNVALDAPQATLMIRHPNFSGMQKDPVTTSYTPARFIKAISVTRGDRSVFAMTSDVSLSTNPVIEFLFEPGSDEPFTVTAIDSADATWTQSFAAPQPMN